MVTHLKQSVLDFKQELPILTALGNPCLKPRHWEALRESTGKSLDPNLSVEKLLALKVNENSRQEHIESWEVSFSYRQGNLQGTYIRKQGSRQCGWNSWNSDRMLHLVGGGVLILYTVKIYQEHIRIALPIMIFCFESQIHKILISHKASLCRAGNMA